MKQRILCSLLIVFCVFVLPLHAARKVMLTPEEAAERAAKYAGKEMVSAEGWESRDDVEFTEQMNNLGTLIHHDTTKMIQFNSLSHQLIEQFQQYRDSLQLDRLQLDTMLAKTASFHNQEMIDENYRSVDFQKDGFPYQGLLFYLRISTDYDVHSYVFSASSMADLQQQWQREKTLLQDLQEPDINQLGLYATQHEEEILCTVYLTQRPIVITEKYSAGGIGLTCSMSLGAKGITSLPFFTMRIYNASFTPKDRPCEIDTSNLVYTQKVVSEPDGTFTFALPDPDGPKRAILFYDNEENPVAIEWLRKKEHFKGLFEKVNGKRIEVDVKRYYEGRYPQGE